MILASHIPVLYCMLYYRTTNSSSHTQRPVFDPSVQISTRTEEKSEELTYDRRSSTERPWTHHSRNKIDLNKVCNNQKGSDFSSGPRVTGHRDPTEQCTLRHPDDIRRMLSTRFLSEGDLQTISSHIEAASTREEHLSRMNYIVRIVARRKKLEPLMAGNCGLCETKPPNPCQPVSWQNPQLTPQKISPKSAENYPILEHLTKCPGMVMSSTCEIGYEVLSEVSDFRGINFTVVNFNNGYQFIATGRCLNENAPCGGILHARCKQIFKAHWTLVWTNDPGVHLVAHEVPSHCECLNLGSSTYPESPHVNNRYLDKNMIVVRVCLTPPNIEQCKNAGDPLRFLCIKKLTGHNVARLTFRDKYMNGKTFPRHCLSSPHNE